MTSRYIITTDEICDDAAIDLDDWHGIITPPFPNMTRAVEWAHKQYFEWLSVGAGAIYVHCLGPAQEHHIRIDIVPNA